MQVKQGTEAKQSLSIEISKEYKSRCEYAPQEGVTLNKELKKLYTLITEEIIEAKNDDQKSIRIGHFNAKMGHRIYVNSNKKRTTINKNGGQI